MTQLYGGPERARDMAVDHKSSQAEQPASIPLRGPDLPVIDAIAARIEAVTSKQQRHAVSADTTGRRCPRCQRVQATRVEVRGVWDNITSRIGLRPFRCAFCGHRFHRFHKPGPARNATEGLATEPLSAFLPHTDRRDFDAVIAEISRAERESWRASTVEGRPQPRSPRDPEAWASLGRVEKRNPRT